MNKVQTTLRNDNIRFIKLAQMPAACTLGELSMSLARNSSFSLRVIFDRPGPGEILNNTVNRSATDSGTRLI